MALTSEQQFIGSYIANGTLGIAPGGFMADLDSIINSSKGDYRAVVKAIAGTPLFATKYPEFLSNDQFAANYTANLLGSSVSADAMVAAKAYVAGKLNAGASRGDVMADALTALYSVPSTDATWGTAATTLQNKAAVAVYYTVDKLQTSTDMDALSSVLKTVTEKAESVTAVKAALDGVTGGTNEAGASYVLTTVQDQYTGTSGNDNFRGVAGAAIGAQDQTTLNSSDIIDGGAGADTLIVNMTGATYNGGARIKNIETLQIGTNQAAATFDYNVNAGSNEVTEVTTIVADQINVGEALTVNNILKTGTAIPTLKWDNEAASTAGTFTSNFRESAVAGDTEVKLVLDDVKSGAFNLGSGANASVETLRVVSQGTTTNTLNASTSGASDGGAVDLAGSSADGVNDNGALAKVIVEGAMAFGKAAGLVTDSTNANYGFMNRVAAGATDAGRDATATASNLISVAATVKEVDASAATGDTNMRFTARVDGAEVGVTYKGGTANDYVEFQQGNISATGGAGNDTFAFVNAQNNSTFTTADSIVGGAGTDTIQMGVNGVGTYNLETTEFNNKTGIDVLDMRGSVNTVKLADAFVVGSDAGLLVRTDKIVQTSDTSTANPVHTNSYLEDNSVNTIDLTALAANRAISVTGGSGSDRLLVNEVSLNSATVFDGGTNVGNNGAVATTGDYDTVTVVNSAVLSRGDLANIKGIEGLVLTETVTGNSNFTVELTEAFILANTASANSTATNADDRILQIVTAAAANGNTLTATDIVKVDVTDLFDSTTNALKQTLVGRQIDTGSAGATVSYVYKGTEYATIAALQAVTSATGGTFVSGADVVGRLEIAGSGASVAAAAAPTYTGTAAADAYTLVANTDTVSMLAGNDTLTIAVATTAAPTGVLSGGDGTDTLSVNGTLSLAGATVSSFENLTIVTNLATTSMTADQYAGFTGTITAAGAADTVVLTTAGTITTTAVAASAGIETYTLASGTNNVTLGGAADATRTITGGTGADTVNTSVANAFNSVFAAGTGSNTLNVTGGMTAVATIGTGPSGAAAMKVTGLENLNISGATTANALTLVSAVAGDFATINASGVTGGGISLTLTNLTAATDRTITLTSGTDTITDLKGTANKLTVDFGAGNATVTDLLVQNTGLTTLKATNSAGSTTGITFSATTADFVTGNATAGTVLDFNVDVTAIKIGAIGAGGTTLAGQLYVDNVTAAANTVFTLDVDGNGVFSAGDIQVTLTGQAYTGAGGAIVAGNFVL